MHPEILRELTAQRGHEMRTQASRVGLARMARRASRRGRSRPDETDGFALPAIPDYVDGSFRTQPASTGPADDKAVSEAGQAPVTHRAA
jgi:hypothetical protein